jgi:hypothetical protein
VVRNNTLRDTAISDWQNPGDLHLDGIETSPSDDDPDSVHNLIEGNRMYNVLDGNTHFMLLRDISNPTVSDWIIRYNTVHDIGSGFIVLGGDSDRVQNTKIYSNTVKDDVLATPEYEDLAVCSGCPGTKLFNNLFYNNVQDNGFVFYLDGPLAGFYASHNLDYLSSCGTSCSWRTTAFPYIKTILNKDPLLSDMQLTVSSPAIDAGGPLTNVSASDPGSGTLLNVNDAGMFQDGFGIVSPDWIAVGSVDNVAQIVSIADDTITVSTPLSRSMGDPVYLHRDSSGRRVLYGNAPDIGSDEYDSGQPCVPTTEICGNGIDEDCDGKDAVCCITTTVLNTRISEWLGGNMMIAALMDAIRIWKAGC